MTLNRRLLIEARFQNWHFAQLNRQVAITHVKIQAVREDNYLMTFKVGNKPGSYWVNLSQLNLA